MGKPWRKPKTLYKNLSSAFDGKIQKIKNDGERSNIRKKTPQGNEKTDGMITN